MIKFFAIISAFTLLATTESGCDYSEQKFNTNCEVKKSNGKVESVVIEFNNSYFQLNNRKDCDNMIESLDSLKFDLELARDQMSVDEKEQEK